MRQQQPMVSSGAALDSRSEILRRAVRRALHVMTPAALLVMSGAPAVAGPQDGIVVRGAASIEASAPNVVNINQTTDRAAINWRSFSIGADEQVNFNQPSSTSATLNRVLGGQRSVIEGALSANGQVFLLNTSGVMFTSSAKVDVGGLVATTSTIRDDDFMAGDLKFLASGQPGGEISNAGSITIRDGGMAALVAPTVRNQGVISARLGRIALGAGETYTLDLYGDQLINFALPGSAGGDLQARTVEQAGSLIADGGQVLLTTDAAAGIVGGVVNMSGIVQARTVGQNERGEIVLAGGDSAVTVSGRLDSSGRDGGQEGGSIDVFGQSVELSSSAVIDSTGSSGGGAVRIGGGFAADDTPRADSTVVAAGATIDTSATDAGNAGTVAVWGNDSAQFAGTIHARGGAHGGDGGFVEVSSKGLLQFLGDVITDAPLGRAGVVLLDPPSIRVEATGSIDPTAAVVSAAALNGMLRRGTPVVLLADESITVNAVIDGRSPGGAGPSGRVEMTAGSIVLMRPVITERNTITLNATSGNVTFGANAYLYVADSTSQSAVGNSAITINAAGSVDAQGLISLGQVSVTATTGSVALAGQFGLNNAGTATGIGSLTVNAGGNAGLHGALTSGGVSVTAGGGIANSGNSIISGGNVGLTAGAGGISLAALSANAPGIDALGAGTVQLRSPGAVVLGSGIRTAGGDISIGTTDQRVASVSDGVATPAPATTGLLLAGGSGDVEILAETLIELQGVSAGGAINIDTNGRLTNAGTAIVAAGGDITLTAGSDEGEGIDARGPASGPALQAADGAEVNVQTGRDVTLGGIRVLDGTINIGTAGARVNGLTLADGAVLQTFSGATTAGAINIYSAAGVDGRGPAAAPVGFITDTLNIDSSTGTVQLDGLFGSADGADHIGSLTVNALGANGNVELRGARTSGEVHVTASGSIVNTDNTLISDGDVALTAGIGITLDVPNDGPGIDARNAANVTLLTPGGAVLLNSAIQTAAGDVTIGQDSAAGRVGSVTYNNVLDAPAASLRAGGDVAVYANDAVTVRGAAAGGTVTIDTDGRLTNSDNSILAGSGVELTAGGDDGEGIELREIRDDAAVLRPSVQVSGAGDASLDTAGAVSIGGGIRTAGGDINIGTTTRVESLTLLPGAILQTFAGAPAGSITINSTGAITARSTNASHVGLVSRDIALDSQGGNIALDELLGLDVDGTATGIGSLSATTGGSGAISLREVEIAGGSGGIDLTAGDGGIDFDPSSASSALAVRGSGGVTLHTSGPVELNGSVSTVTGSIEIGEAGNRADRVTMAAGTQLRTQTGDVNLQLGAGSSVIGSIIGTAAGGDAARVTIRSEGSVALLGAIGAPALAEEPDPEDEPQPRLDTPAFVDIEAASIVFRGAETSGENATGEGVRLVATGGAGARVDLYGQIWSHGGRVVIGRAATTDSDATINLSHNVLTDGYGIDLNGNVILFDGIGLWGSDGLEAALRSSPDDPAYFLTEVFSQRPRGITDPDISGFFDGGTTGYLHDPRALCLDPALCTADPPPEGELDQSRPTDADVMRFIGSNQTIYNLEARDSQGAVMGLPASGTGSCIQWICGYHFPDATPVDGPGGLLAQAVERERRFQNLLGVLSVRIDTDAGGSPGGNDFNVNVSGSLGRHVANPLANRGSGVPIPDGFVNHELVINVGAGEFNVTGAFGDTFDQSERVVTAGTGSLVLNPGNGRFQLDTAEVGFPDLGLFGVVIESGTVTVPNNAGDQYVNSISGAAGDFSQRVTLQDFDYLFPVAWTDRSRGQLLPNDLPPGAGPFVPPVIGNELDDRGSSGIVGSAPPARDAVTGSGSQGNGTSGGSLGPGVDGAGTDVSSDVGAVGGFGVPSTADDQQRDDEEEDDSSQDATRTSETSSDQCPRGAAQEADLGATRAVDGAAADVFERCEGS